MSWQNTCGHDVVNIYVKTTIDLQQDLNAELRKKDILLENLDTAISNLTIHFDHIYSSVCKTKNM